jgi:hypothetical protein
VVDVGRDDQAAAGDFRADQLDVEVFAAGDVVHLRGDGVLAGGFELGHRRVSLSYAGMNRIRFTGCVLSRGDGPRHPQRCDYDCRPGGGAVKEPGRAGRWIARVVRL